MAGAVSVFEVIVTQSTLRNDSQNYKGTLPGTRQVVVWEGSLSSTHQLKGMKKYLRLNQFFTDSSRFEDI